MSGINYVTKETLEQMKQELQRMKAVDRPAASRAIAEAREKGDLKENAEYDAAREEQGLLETRIAEIEDIVNNAEIIKASKKSIVGLGSRVELKTGAKKVVYTIVGPVEANPLEGKVSNESPIGMALHGKKVDDKVTISTPKGDIHYTVVSVG